MTVNSLLDTSLPVTINRLRNLIFLTLIYSLLVILWGAWVRISHSGDGCGDTWPLCQGQLIPEAQQGKTWVEYAHRAMSGFYGFLILFLYFSVKKFFPLGHRARKYGFWLLFFCIIEALLGAKLVLFKLVGTNDSFYRAFVIGIHQVNSLLLTGVSALLVMTSAEDTIRPPLRFPGKAFAKFFFFMVIAMTGAWAALSSTLFPATSLSESFNKEFSPDSPLLMHLRTLHPVFAVVIGTYICVWLYRKVNSAQGFIKDVYLQTSALWAVGVIFGMLTLILLSPTWMKIGHLLLAHLLWISLLRLFYLRDQIS